MAYGVNAPFGLQSRFTLNSSTLSGQQTLYSIASGYASPLFSGDPVTFLANGTIGICPPGTPAVGVLGAVKFTDALGNYFTQSFWPAGQITLGGQPANAYVIDDPNVEYDIQVSNSANAANPTITAAQIGQNANFAIGGGGANIVPANPTSGSTRTGISGYYLDLSTVGLANDLSLKILRFTPSIKNLPSQPFNNVIVTLNNNFFTSRGVGYYNNISNVTGPITGNYNALLKDQVIDVSSAGGIVTVTLPAANAQGVTGKTYTIKNVSASVNGITINGGGTYIDGAPAIAITKAYGYVTVFSNGVQWFTSSILIA